MIRLLLILALAFGVYYAYNSFNTYSRESTEKSLKNIKIIKMVNDGRAKMQSDAENAGNF